MPTEDRILVEDLAAPHRASAAYKRLMMRGQDALPAILAGLVHRSADARYHCCRLLDHLLTPQALAPLVSMLDDPDERVRCSALHSLSCDRCKKNVCLPTDGLVLAKAMKLLGADPSAHVRAMAIEAVGRSAHDDPAALVAIETAASSDLSAAVRKKARWYAPGGPIFRRAAHRARSAA